MIYESSASSRCAAGPKIAAIGGGTGLSTMLRGLKKYTDRLTAIVTVADDGGGSGRLPGDETARLHPDRTVHAAVGADAAAGCEDVFQSPRQQDPVGNTVALPRIPVLIAFEERGAGVGFSVRRGAGAVQVDRISVPADLVVEHRLPDERSPDS